MAPFFMPVFMQNGMLEVLLRKEINLEVAVSWVNDLKYNISL